MPDIADAKANINDVEVDADAALSEALFEKIGGAINYLNTTTDDHETRITTFETENSASTGAPSAGTISATGTILSAALSALNGTKALVIGRITVATSNFSGSIDVTVQLRRNGSVLKSITVSGANSDSIDYIFIDTGLTDTTVYTYDLYCSSYSSGGGTATYSLATVGALDFK